MKLKRKYKMYVVCAALVLVAATAVSIFTFTRQSRAEQSGGSPESGETSRLKATYTSLTGLGHGSDAAGGWGDWGAYFNRVRSAGEWVPTDDAAVTDVKSGKTFHNTSRTQATGTYPNPTSCSTQQYHDSYGAPVTQTTNCVNTITWSDPGGGITGTDKVDARTGLIWSKYLKINVNTVEFADAGGSTWNWDGTDNAQGVNNKAANGGVAPGKTASQLCSERGNGWRLPSQKEMMQAYIDGSYFNLTNPSNSFWSVTEDSGTNAWYVSLYNGTTISGTKATTAYYVRCVR